MLKHDEILQDCKNKFDKPIPNNEHKIPNIVHYTFCTLINLPLYIAATILQNKTICKHCKFIFYDDIDCEKFIKEHFTDIVYTAYLKINPSYGAMRADFFRYCVLYAIGGIYIVIKSAIKFPLFKIIQPNDTCLLDYPRTNLEPWRTKRPAFEQWLLIFAPHHPYLLSMINQMVKYIHNSYIPQFAYGTKLTKKGQILHITGPDAFTQAIFAYLQANPTKLHRTIDYQKYFSLNIDVFDYTAMYTINNKQHYSLITEPLYITIKDVCLIEEERLAQEAVLVAIQSEEERVANEAKCAEEERLAEEVALTKKAILMTAEAV